MAYPPTPDASAIADHFSAALRRARRDEWPYRHWKLADVSARIAVHRHPHAADRSAAARQDRRDARHLQQAALLHHAAVALEVSDLRGAVRRPAAPRRRAAAGRDLRNPGRGRVSADGVHPGHRRRLARAPPRHSGKAVLDGHLFLHRAGRARLGHRHLRRRAPLGRPILRGIQFGRHLRARTGDLARLRSAADRRRSSADGNQLRPPEIGATASNWRFPIAPSRPRSEIAA